MKQENEWLNVPSGTPPVSEVAGKDRAATGYPGAPAKRVVGGPLIDFHSAEFNRIDDLNDNSRNYRLFESLDGVVTAHERHQMEHGRRANTLDSPEDVGALLKKHEIGEDGDEALAEPPEMRGRFKKFQFVSIVKTRCFHGRSRARDCRQCLDVCPFGAIRSIERTLSINHYLCQGCGGCALVCPADAIHVIQPSPEDLVKAVGSVLEKLSLGGVSPSILIISDSGHAGGNEGLSTVASSDGCTVHVRVEQIAHVGLAVLLGALAYGAGAVLVECAPQNPPNVRKAVDMQVQMARAVLEGLGLPEDKCRFALAGCGGADSGATALNPAGLDGQANHFQALPATWRPGQYGWQDRRQDGWNDRRALVRDAVRHLCHQSGARVPLLPLPVGSPFGAVVVNGAACTLCMACVVACPSGALSASADAPRLLFQESQCHQCGLCAETCPEAAIELLPRLLCDTGGVEAGRVLHEAQPLRCIECGAPFASHAMINRIREKLTGHWMYTNERQVRRLQMCRTCSARDALTSTEMKSWNLQ